MPTILSLTDYKSFKTISWHNAATKAIGKAANQVILTKRGKKLSTILDGFGVYKSKAVSKTDNKGVVIYKIRQFEVSDLSKDTLLVTEKFIKEFINKLPLELKELAKYNDIKYKETAPEHAGEHWGWMIIIPVCRIRDIESHRADVAKKVEEEVK